MGMWMLLPRLAKTGGSRMQVHLPFCRVVMDQAYIAARRAFRSPATASSAGQRPQLIGAPCQSSVAAAPQVPGRQRGGDAAVGALRRRRPQLRRHEAGRRGGQGARQHAIVGRDPGCAPSRSVRADIQAGSIQGRGQQWHIHVSVSRNDRKILCRVALGCSHEMTYVGMCYLEQPCDGGTACT